MASNRGSACWATSNSASDEALLHVERSTLRSGPGDRPAWTTLQLPDDARDTQRIPPGGTPGWATLNFRVGYAWREQLFLTAALENSLNEDYRLHGSGYNQPGRNFKVGTEWRF